MDAECLCHKLKANVVPDSTEGYGLYIESTPAISDFCNESQRLGLEQVRYFPTSDL